MRKACAVNAMEDELPKDAIVTFRDKVFKTKTGEQDRMFGTISTKQINSHENRMPLLQKRPFRIHIINIMMNI